MLKQLKDWLLGSSKAEAAPPAFGEPEIATAALLVEAATIDGLFESRERETIERLLQERFSLSPEGAATLLAVAEARHSKADAVFKFALETRNAFSEAERADFLEMLWTTILSNGSVHTFEDNLMRRIAGLLHVPDRAAGEARKRAAVKVAARDGVRGDGA